MDRAAPSDTTADEIRNALASWLDAFNGRDVDALMAIYDPQAVYANAAASLMRGKDEIRPWFENALAGTRATACFKEEALFSGADLSLIVGKFYTKFAQEGQDEESGETGRVGLVFRRSEAGSWRLAFDMDNRPPDVDVRDFA
ncbi:MAG: nuclear transport factor 2 family protein [Acidobacteriota bacterium]